jgi:hypothetical protein
MTVHSCGFRKRDSDTVSTVAERVFDIPDMMSVTADSVKNIPAYSPELRILQMTSPTGCPRLRKVCLTSPTGNPQSGEVSLRSATGNPQSRTMYRTSRHEIRSYGRCAGHHRREIRHAGEYAADGTGMARPVSCRIAGKGAGRVAPYNGFPMCGGKG